MVVRPLNFTVRGAVKAHVATLLAFFTAVAQLSAAAEKPAALTVAIRVSDFPSSELGDATVIDLADAKKQFRLEFGELQLATLSFVPLGDCTVRIELTSSKWEDARVPSAWPFVAKHGDAFSLAYRFGHEVQRLVGAVQGHGKCAPHP
jgi:hypothetical protein